MSRRTIVDIIVYIILFILFYSSMAKALDIYSYKTSYDSHFKKYSKRFFGVTYNWYWFKAQGIAESNLKLDAISPVGAMGVMQLMPDTHDEIRQELNIPDARYSARWNIAGGIYYDKKLYNQWTSPRPELDRKNLMFASYNAGLGNILKAQQECVEKQQECKTCHDINTITQKLNCNLWDVIEQFGVIVDTWKQEETIGYVKRINKYMKIE